MRRRSEEPAFTLIELLTVMAIILLIAGLALPATTSIIRSMHLSQAADVVVRQINTLRIKAITSNRAMEVRFYKLIDPSNPGAPPAFRALQVFQIEDNGDVRPDGRVQWLPGTVIIDAGPQVSSLLDGSREKTSWTTSDPKLSLPRLAAPGTDYGAWCLRFRVDGTVDLDSTQKWFISLHSDTDEDNRTSLPVNFATIQIDPASGTTKLYRP